MLFNVHQWTWATTRPGTLRQQSRSIVHRSWLSLSLGTMVLGMCRHILNSLCCSRRFACSSVSPDCFGYERLDVLLARVIARFMLFNVHQWTRVQFPRTEWMSGLGQTQRPWTCHPRKIRESQTQTC